MPSVLISTTADADHFPMAMELFDSIRGFPELAGFQLGVLDIGLTDSQLISLKTSNVVVAKATWEFPFESPAGMPHSFLAMLSRPFLPKYFPGFDVYIYLDSDVWVQEASGILDLVDSAERASVAVIPELHPSYLHLYAPDNNLRRMHLDCFASMYGIGVPQPAHYVVFNVGVMAAGRESNLWPMWQRSLAQGIEARLLQARSTGEHVLIDKNPVNTFMEQNALNYAFYAGQISIYPLSAHYNWVCSLCVPLLDPASGKLVEPTPPRVPIKNVHLTQLGKLINEVRDIRGDPHVASLRWPKWMKFREQLLAGHSGTTRRT